MMARDIEQKILIVVKLKEEVDKERINKLYRRTHARQYTLRKNYSK